jgi:hypothetical protein
MFPCRVSRSSGTLLYVIVGCGNAVAFSMLSVEVTMISNALNKLAAIRLLDDNSMVTTSRREYENIYSCRT